MKKVFLIILVLVTSNSFAQESIKVSLCDNEVKHRKNEKVDYNYISLTQEKLFECLELKTNDNNWNVNSFSIGFTVGSDYLEIKTIGNFINDKMLEAIKKHNPTKIYIEKIELINKVGEASKTYLVLEIQ